MQTNGFTSFAALSAEKMTSRVLLYKPAPRGFFFLSFVFFFSFSLCEPHAHTIINQ